MEEKGMGRLSRCLWVHLHLDEVLASGTDDDWPVMHKLDNSNNPYILSVVGARDGPHDNRGTYAFKLSKRNGSSWVTSTVATGADHLFDRGALKVVDPNNINAFLTLGGQSGQTEEKFKNIAVATVETRGQKQRTLPLIQRISITIRR